ncbi:MAG: hypothetical protein ACOCXP_02505, partial [Candidatus Dojkabacteria bacterium]
MEVKEIVNWQEWEDLLLTSSEYSFLQSWQQGELQTALGNRVGRLAYSIDGMPLVLLQYVIVAAKRGKVMQLRHAPVFLDGYLRLELEQKQAIWQEVLSDIRERAKLADCHFIRVQA